MRYMGSKNKIAKHLTPTMLRSRGGRVWVEPFVGGANMIQRICGQRIGSDTQYYVVELLKAIQIGWVPPTKISKEFYQLVRQNKSNYPPELVGFIGQCCTFGGKWWGGYAADRQNTNYAERGSRVLVKQAKNLKDVEFRCSNYLDLEIPPNSLVYCDPPYKDTTKYSNDFDHKIFWQWCRDKVLQGHIIFVSEYNAPDDFECIKTVTHKTILNKNKQDIRIEKLFKHNSQQRR